jgi:GNAT superfamily N-acetyltransferase
MSDCPAFATVPEFRFKGIGKAMSRVLKSIAKSAGCERILVAATLKARVPRLK